MNPLSSDPNGFEMDSDLAGGAPVTDITIDNVTLCGTGGDELSLTYGMVLRENLEGTFSNIVVSGFNAAVDVRDDFGSESSPNVTLTDSAFFDGVTHDVAYDETMAGCTDAPTCDDDAGFDEREWVSDGEGNSNPTE
ncbi:MAG TPA: hypothetical protein VI197_18005 [Polyangiaceae bacterium]